MAGNAKRVGKKLAAVEAQFVALPVAARTEATFRALADAKGVSAKAYSDRWAMVWALVEAVCRGMVCKHGVAQGAS